jgi:hypothetical protein
MDWIKPRAKPYTDQLVHLISVAELAAAPDKFALIWPERPALRA